MRRQYHSRTMDTMHMLSRVVARETKRLDQADEAASSSNGGLPIPLVPAELCVRFWDACVSGLMQLESVWKVYKGSKQHHQGIRKTNNLVVRCSSLPGDREGACS
jgi:hypothetical protein